MTRLSKPVNRIDQALRSQPEDADDLVCSPEYGCDVNSLEKPANLQSALKQTVKVTVEEEQKLFQQLQFLKFRRESIESTLETSGRSRKVTKELAQLTQQIDATRNAITEAFLKLLASIARSVAPSPQEFDDYFSEGSTVLMHAINKFDPSRGYRFSTYATHAVRRHLYRFCKKRSKKQKREVASEMAFRGEVDSNVEDRLNEQETIEATSMLMSQIESALDEREREIVVGRFGLGGDTKGKSFQAISNYMGLSKERVRQLFNQAIGKLERSVRPHFE